MSKHENDDVSRGTRLLITGTCNLYKRGVGGLFPRACGSRVRTCVRVGRRRCERGLDRSCLGRGLGRSW
jgi:hypothetical protein